MVKTNEHVTRTYTAADGKTFNNEAAARAYEDTLTLEQWFTINWPKLDMADNNSVLWEVSEENTRAVHHESEPAGFLRQYQEEYTSYDTYYSGSVLGYGSNRELMKFCIAKYPNRIRRGRIRIQNPKVKCFAEEIGQRVVE